MSISGCQYYLLLLDDYNHFAWTFPLKHKSDVFPTLRHFFAFVHNHFNLPVLTLQTDNGREFDNQAARTLFSSLGVVLRMSCPYSSPQNGRAECILRTLNNVTRSLLVHASMSYTLWVEALNTATFLLNRRPCRSRHNHTPFFLLYGAQLTYTAICVFGCLCYPNLTSTSAHKLVPRSHPCVICPEHKGYRCLNRSTGCVIISRHVVFDEHTFPFAADGVPPG